PVALVGRPFLLSSLVVTMTTLPVRAPTLVPLRAPAPAPAAALVPGVPVSGPALLASSCLIPLRPIPARAPTSRVPVPGPAILVSVGFIPRRPIPARAPTSMRLRLIPTSALICGHQRCVPPVFPRTPGRRRLGAVVFLFAPGRGVLRHVDILSDGPGKRGVAR
ncbi:unnamed protein product, partial [Ectocarpus fasciculatus]